MRTADEVIQFRSYWGRFPVTRGERYRLARLHGLAESEARALAFGSGGAPALHPGPVPPATYPAEELARAFDAEGNARRDARGLGIIPHCGGRRDTGVRA